ncbi:hypothetical protein K491DRAFT_258839 [Lophiostoma macrostomum CBS 122681]|uniref:Uncharacterized protein n=1 Tax=Lophiostoma macrostomum CBS 122681 TaxID=1314788 RepID=A0A6A6TIP6_9PLEO|nr:hypothetical protein K491DRAFT_258839 [Lophiostoma macrostomum CBS 122681]
MRRGGFGGRAGAAGGGCEAREGRRSCACRIEARCDVRAGAGAGDWQRGRVQQRAAGGEQEMARATARGVAMGGRGRAGGAAVSWGSGEVYRQALSSLPTAAGC